MQGSRERYCLKDGVVAYALNTKQERPRTGRETTSQFWGKHHTVDIRDSKIGYSGIPLDVRGSLVSTSDSDKHCMICGVSGKGKTRRELYPTVVMSARASRSMVIADMKGEIYRNTANEVKRCGLGIKVINLRNPSFGDRFNPLSIVQKYWNDGQKSRATIMLRDIAQLITKKISSERDSYWQFAAQDAFMGFALIILESCYPLTFEAIQNLCNQYYQDFNGPRETLKFIDSEADYYNRLSTILNLSAENTLSCIVSELNAALSCFVDQKDVIDLLSDSDFRLTDLGRRPVAVYLICPDESTSLYEIASLFIEQCYSELINFADTREDNTLPIKVDFILDEFGSFVGSDWPNKLTAARSRGIRFILALQSMSQLVARYGENGSRTILSNCRTLVFMGGRDLRLINEISMMSGSVMDYVTGMDKPNITVFDLNCIKPGEIVVLDDGCLPYFGNLPEWTAWNINDRATISETRRKHKKQAMLPLLDILELNHARRVRENERYEGTAELPF